MEVTTIIESKLLGEELAFLLHDKGGPCLTMTIPLEKLNPTREANKRRVLELVEKSATQLKYLQEQFDDEGIAVLEKAKELIETIDWLHVPYGIGIYVSLKNKLLYQFDFSPPEKAIWSDRFMLRELIYHIQLSQPFLLLCLTETKSCLYQKKENAWEKLKDNHVNKNYSDNYLYESPSRSTSYAGQAHVKSFERDREKLETAHRIPHLNRIKAQLKKYQTASLPIAVIATDQLLHEINLPNNPHEPVIEIQKDPSHLTPRELGQIAEPYIFRFTENKIERIVTEWNELVGKGFTRSGLQASWRAAQEGNCKILLVELGYSKTGFLLQDPFYLF